MPRCGPAAAPCGWRWAEVLLGGLLLLPLPGRGGMLHWAGALHEGANVAAAAAEAAAALTLEGAGGGGALGLVGFPSSPVSAADAH